jgi:hypothetical protein
MEALTASGAKIIRPAPPSGNDALQTFAIAFPYRQHLPVFEHDGVILHVIDMAAVDDKGFVDAEKVFVGQFGLKA